MNRFLSLSSLTCGAVLLAASTQASVISIAQQSAVGFASPSSNAWSNSAGDFVVGDAGSVLVLFTYGDGSTLNTITFDGESADGIFSSSDSPGRLSAAYWLTPSTSATAQLSVTTTGINNDSLFYFVELAGVDTSVAPTASTTDTITTTVADQFILAAAARNSSLTSTVPSASSSSPLDDGPFSSVVTLADFGSSDGGMIRAASGQAPTPGEINVQWFSENYQLALAFTPVPEPGSLALIAMGGVLMARRRRG